MFNRYPEIASPKYNKTVAQSRDAVFSDFKNYTNIQPVVQISEIKQVRHNDIK